MTEDLKISVISPVYKASSIIEEFIRQVVSNLESISNNYEIILIEDHGNDDSWDKINKIARHNPKVNGYKFSRNFGQHAAIKAGLTKATGDVAIIMDCDLQDNPKYFQEILDCYQAGNDIVYTVKKTRNHSFFKNLTANIYNTIFNWLSNSKNVSSDTKIGAYSLISRKVINAFLLFNDYQFHYLLVLKWIGHTSGYVEIEHDKRTDGKSTYSIKKLYEHALVGIIYQSDKLLRLSIYVGISVAFISALFGLWIIVKSFFADFQAGWPSVMVMILFSSGIILSSIGILGLYLGKMFEQVKNRPQYIIEKQT